MNRLAETLQREEELRKESVADLAHELRTPVNGLLGRIEAAQDGVLSDESANLAAMHEEAVRLSRLLDDLSSLAEAERPGLLLTVEPVDLAAVAEAQSRLFERRFREKQHRALRRPSRRRSSTAIQGASSRSSSTCSPTHSATPTPAAR